MTQPRLCLVVAIIGSFWLFGPGQRLFAQDGLQFNAPYLCSDGSTYVVHRCQKGPKFEFCYYQRDQNSERYNVRASVWNQMRQCKVKSAPSSTAAAQPSPDLNNSRWDCGSGA